MPFIPRVIEHPKDQSAIVFPILVVRVIYYSIEIDFLGESNSVRSDSISEARCILQQQKCTDYIYNGTTVTFTLAKKANTLNNDQVLNDYSYR